LWFRILNTLSLLTGPNIFLRACLSKPTKLYDSQLWQSHVSLRLIRVCYIYMLLSKAIHLIQKMNDTYLTTSMRLIFRNRNSGTHPPRMEEPLK
jgi:hypothetical protein